jgi:hypothetical protein
MKRVIYDHLLNWKNRLQHKPLILRGARRGSMFEKHRIFLQSHSQPPYGVRFSTNNY